MTIFFRQDFGSSFAFAINWWVNIYMVVLTISFSYLTWNNIYSQKRHIQQVSCILYLIKWNVHTVIRFTVYKHNSNIISKDIYAILPIIGKPHWKIPCRKLPRKLPRKLCKKLYRKLHGKLYGKLCGKLYRKQHEKLYSNFSPDPI